MNKPQVFIIESLTLTDERADLFEGRILEQILALSGKECCYYYVRTKRELKEIIKEFSASGSAHANATGIATTFDRLSFAELGDILRPFLKRRRVFFSACKMAKKPLAVQLLSRSECYSVMGPSKNVAFADAALLWSSFYHLMFR